MEIIQQTDVPKAMIALISNEYENISTIEKVIILAGTDQLEGQMAVFVPGTDSVIIDLKACMENQQWMKRGMGFVPNTWCNIIYAVFHERIHAEQFRDLGEDMFEMAEEDLDEDADIRALELMIDWFETNKKVPVLDELGWVGAQIKQLFNDLYIEAPEFVDMEMSMLGTEAGGLAMGMRMNHYFEDEEKFNGMLLQIMHGDIGLNVQNNACLRVGDVLEVISNTNRR